MKKEKSMVILATLSFLVSIFLTINIILQNEESECLKKVEEMQKNVTEQYLHLIHSTQGLFFIFTNLLIANHTNLVVSENKIVIPIEPNLQNFTTNITNSMSDAQKDISSLQKQITIKKDECNKKSLSATGVLYIALVINLVSVLYGFLIYRLYKT